MTLHWGWLQDCKGVICRQSCSSGGYCHSIGVKREVGLCPFKAWLLVLQLQYFVNVVDFVSTLSLQCFSLFKDWVSQRGKLRTRKQIFIIVTIFISGIWSNDRNKKLKGNTDDMVKNSLKPGESISQPAQHFPSVVLSNYHNAENFQCKNTPWVRAGFPPLRRHGGCVTTKWHPQWCLGDNPSSLCCCWWGPPAPDPLCQSHPAHPLPPCCTSLRPVVHAGSNCKGPTLSEQPKHHPRHSPFWGCLISCCLQPAPCSVWLLTIRVSESPVGKDGNGGWENISGFSLDLSASFHAGFSQIF